MFELLRENRDVDDAPDAPELLVKDGAVEFQNVTFGYLPERTILKNVSFKVPAGRTLALVSCETKSNDGFFRYNFMCRIFFK